MILNFNMHVFYHASNLYKHVSKNSRTRSDTCKNSGILVSGNFSFNKHIKALVRQCKQINNWRMRTSQRKKT